MSEFSEYLERYMKEQEVTAAELARELAVDRTTIFRYMKGKREPQNAEIVRNMADALHMTLPDRKHLLEKYDSLVLGDETVNGHKYVKKLLCDIKYAGRKAEKVLQDKLWKEDGRLPEGTLCLNGRKEIEICALSMFFHFAGQRGENTLYLLMQPEYEEIQDALLSVFGSGNRGRIKIEQIICLEQRVQKSYENLEHFRRILPLCFSDIPYEVRYYYDFVTNHINGMSWMPNVILGEGCVLQFDYAMSRGIFIRDEIYARAVRGQYESFRKQSVPLAVKGTDIHKSLPIYGKMLSDMAEKEEREGAEVAAVFLKPCMAACISSDIYEQYLLPVPEKKKFVKMMESAYGDWKGMEYCAPPGGRGIKICSYFQKEGLRNFMETGRLGEFPDGYYQPLPMEVRRQVLARMIKLVKSKAVTYRLLPEDMELPEQICFYWGKGERRLYLHYVKSKDITQIRIAEPGICRVFRRWLGYLEEKGMLCSVEETVSLLKEMAGYKGEF